MDETQVVLDDLEADPASSLTFAESPFASINERLTEYGLSVCGSDG